MQITMIAFGTRGDVQPMIALGKGLKHHGHHVTLLASRNFADWIQAHGLDIAPSSIDIQALMQGIGGQQWIEHGNNPILQQRVMRNLLKEAAMPMMQETWEASRNADLLLGSFTSAFYADAIAAKRDIRHATLLLQPSATATRDGRVALAAVRSNHVSWLNYAFTKLVIDGFVWNIAGELGNRFRREVLHLPELSRRQFAANQAANLTLHGYSQHVVPHPADWSPQFHTVGYWFLDEGNAWTPPAELTQFLADGAPPLVLGFGSMTGDQPEAITRLLVDAVERSGQRAIVLSGWAGLGDVALPPTIVRLASAPHDWLFPQVAAVVHHGGAGTTAAVLRAGKPSIIVPHLADQQFWGRRISALGVGTKPILRHKLTVEKLSDAINQVMNNSALTNNAQRLARLINAEDGVSRAIELLRV